jgi:hypothetical protein
MADLPEEYQRLLHGISTAGGDGNRRSALEAEVQISLVRGQINSASAP